MDGLRDYHSKQSKSERERHIMLRKENCTWLIVPWPLKPGSKANVPLSDLLLGLRIYKDEYGKQRHDGRVEERELTPLS